MKRLMTVLAMLLFGGSVAQAAGSMFFSGHMCQWRWPGNSGNQYTVYGVYNSNSGNYDDVFCPLTYAIPQTGSYQPERYDAVHVHVYDGSQGGNIDCVVEEVNWDGSLHQSADQLTTNYFTGISQLNFTQPINVTNQYPLSASLYCHLGPLSTIYGYDLTYHEQ